MRRSTPSHNAGGSARRRPILRFRARPTAEVPASWRLRNSSIRADSEVTGLAEPVQITPDAGGEGGDRRPVEQFLGLPVGNADALVVGVAGGRVVHRHLADQV